MRGPHLGAARFLESTFAPLLASGRLLIDKPMILPHDGEPEPDLTVVPAATPLTQVPVVDDVQLAIEVSHSTRRFDRGPKLRAYLRDGIRELWIVDLETRELLVFRDRRLVATFLPGQGLELSAAEVPEISVDVDALFAAAAMPPGTR
jgi:Uma2 family endonuclease